MQCPSLPLALDSAERQGGLPDPPLFPTCYPADPSHPLTPHTQAPSCGTLWPIFPGHSHAPSNLNIRYCTLTNSTKMDASGHRYGADMVLQSVAHWGRSNANTAQAQVPPKSRCRRSALCVYVCTYDHKAVSRRTSIVPIRRVSPTTCQAANFQWPAPTLQRNNMFTCRGHSCLPWHIITPETGPVMRSEVMRSHAMCQRHCIGTPTPRARVTLHVQPPHMAAHASVARPRHPRTTGTSTAAPPPLLPAPCVMR